MTTLNTQHNNSTNYIAQNDSTNVKKHLVKIKVAYTTANTTAQILEQIQQNLKKGQHNYNINTSDVTTEEFQTRSAKFEIRSAQTQYKMSLS